ncbi:MAG: iron chelate uptake ABC transporter family permease subunit, partial [Pseudomonadota bacterium]
MTALGEMGGQRDAPLAGDRRRLARRTTVGLALLLVCVSVLSLAQGAAGTSLWSALSSIAAGEPLELRDRVVLLDIRLPRLVMGILVGAALAV